MLGAWKESGLDHLTRKTSGNPVRSSRSYAKLTLDDETVRYPACLRWTCVRCANSCRDLPGHKRSILLTGHDTERIARTTGRATREFSTALRSHFPYERKMKKVRGRCIFLNGSTCSIYKARPLICRFYPFFLRRSGKRALEIGFDPACSGIGSGTVPGEEFYQRLTRLAKRELPKE